MLKNLISENAALWPQISLVLFLVFFLSMLVWVFRRNGRKHYETMAHLVMDEKKTTQKMEISYE